MSSGDRHPFHPSVLLSGILIGLFATVIGGVILAIIIGEGRFAPAVPTPVTLNSTATINPAASPQVSATEPIATQEVVKSPCTPQTNWTPPAPATNGEWIYDCLSSGAGNWVGQTEAWKTQNWKRGTGQSEIVNIVVPAGATKMGVGCNPCTIVAPNGSSLSPNCLGKSECFGSFRPNASLNVSTGEIYRVQIFGTDSCPNRTGATPPCPPEIYVWLNLP